MLSGAGEGVRQSVRDSSLQLRLSGREVLSVGEEVSSAESQ